MAESAFQDGIFLALGRRKETAKRVPKFVPTRCVLKCERKGRTRGLNFTG